MEEHEPRDHRRPGAAHGVLTIFNRVIPRNASWIDLAVVLFVGLILYGGRTRTPSGSSGRS